MPEPSDALMQMLSSGGQAGQQGVGASQQPGGTPGAPGQEAAGSAPMGSPMSTPEKKSGSQAGAQINVQMALDLLQQSLPAFDPNSQESQAIMKTLGDMTKVFGSREADTRKLIPSEILQMNQALPQAGGATPEQKTMQAAPIPGMQSQPSAM